MMDGDPIDSSMNNAQSLDGVRGLGDMHFLTDFSSPLDSGIGEHGAMTTEMQLGQSEYYALSGFSLDLSSGSNQKQSVRAFPHIEQQPVKSIPRRPPGLG